MIYNESNKITMLKSDGTVKVFNEDNEEIEYGEEDDYLNKYFYYNENKEVHLINGNSEESIDIGNYGFSDHSVKGYLSEINDQAVIKWYNNNEEDREDFKLILVDTTTEQITDISDVLSSGYNVDVNSVDYDANVTSDEISYVILGEPKSIVIKKDNTILNIPHVTGGVPDGIELASNGQALIYYFDGFDTPFYDFTLVKKNGTYEVITPPSGATGFLEFEGAHSGEFIITYNNFDSKYITANGNIIDIPKLTGFTVGDVKKYISAKNGSVILYFYNSESGMYYKDIIHIKNYGTYRTISAPDEAVNLKNTFLVDEGSGVILYDGTTKFNIISKDGDITEVPETDGKSSMDFEFTGSVENSRSNINKLGNIIVRFNSGGIFYAINSDGTYTKVEPDSSFGSLIFGIEATKFGIFIVKYDTNNFYIFSNNKVINPVTFDFDGEDASLYTLNFHTGKVDKGFVYYEKTADSGEFLKDMFLFQKDGSYKKILAPKNATNFSGNIQSGTELAFTLEYIYPFNKAKYTNLINKDGGVIVY